jgi:hypothetical protein
MFPKRLEAPFLKITDDGAEMILQGHTFIDTEKPGGWMPAAVRYTAGDADLDSHVAHTFGRRGARGRAFP